MKKLYIFAFLLATLFTLSNETYAYHTNYIIYNWNIPQNDAVNKYLETPAHTNFSFKDDKNYKNMIMKRFLALNTALINKMKIIRSNCMPQRDLLFISGKLYSIMEVQRDVNPKKFKTLFIKIKKIYGTPTLKKERNLTFYSFKNQNTDVIFITRSNGGHYDIKIYFYNHFWARSLLFE